MKVNVCNVSNATYGNGCSLDYHYDDYGRITSVTTEENNNTVTLASYKYNKKNQVTKFTDGKSGETTEYCYDCNGNTLYKYLISEDGELLRVVEAIRKKLPLTAQCVLLQAARTTAESPTSKTVTPK